MVRADQRHLQFLHLYGISFMVWDCWLVLVDLYCLVQCVDQMKRMFAEAMKYLAASLFLGILFSVILEVFICCSNNKLFLFFGADDLTLSMAQAYLKPIQFVIPLFLLNQLIAAFLRNDGNPGLATFVMIKMLNTPIYPLLNPLCHFFEHLYSSEHLYSNTNFF